MLLGFPSQELYNPARVVKFDLLDGQDLYDIQVSTSVNLRQRKLSSTDVCWLLRCFAEKLHEPVSSVPFPREKAHGRSPGGISACMAIICTVETQEFMPTTFQKGATRVTHVIGPH